MCKELLMHQRLTWNSRDLTDTDLAPEVGIRLATNKLGISDEGIKSTMTYESNRLEPTEALTALLSAACRNLLCSIGCSTTCRHLGLRHVFQLVHILATCKNALKRAAGVRVIHVLRQRYIVQLGEALDHLYFILGLELVYLYRMTKFLGYFAQLCLYYLRGVGVTRIHALAIATHQHKARRYSRTIYCIIVVLDYTPVRASYQYVGAQICSTAYSRYIYVFAEDLLHCSPDIWGVLGLSVYYSMIFGDSEIYISIGCTIQYACVLIAIHRLQLLTPKPHTRIGIISIQLVLAEDIRAFLPAFARKELGVFIIAAGDYPQGAHKHIQWAALAVSGHLVIWYDHSSGRFVAVSARQLIPDLHRGIHSSIYLNALACLHNVSNHTRVRMLPHLTLISE